MNSQKLMLVVGVPVAHLQPVLDAMAAAGAGVLGEYTHCSVANEGIGRFMPSAAANPVLGQHEQINLEAEVRVETFCERNKAKGIV